MEKNYHNTRKYSGVPKSTFYRKINQLNSNCSSLTPSTSANSLTANATEIVDTTTSYPGAVPNIVFDNVDSVKIRNCLQDYNESDESDEIDECEESDDDEIMSYFEDEFEMEDDQHSNDSEVDMNLNTNLVRWVIMNRISKDATSSLLKILRDDYKLNLPKTRNALLKTDYIDQIDTKLVDPGEYFHFGIQNMITKLNHEFFKCTDHIEIDIGIDGLPLYKSSDLCLWPILGVFVNQKSLDPFLIGCFSGEKKPTSADIFLEDFAREYNLLTKQGVYVSNNRMQILKKFSVRLFLLDTVARCFITGTKAHNSSQGCHKCDQTGTTILNTMSFKTFSGKLRTDKSFLNREDVNHHLHQYVSQLSELEVVGIKMVSQFVLEPMHLFDLGVTKKILLSMLNKNLYGPPNLKNKQIELMSKMYSSFSKNTPSEYGRKPRSFSKVHKWKSIEFRQFALYTGIVILKEFVDPDVYNHFLLFHAAYRLLEEPAANPALIDLAENLLNDFVETFPYVYGEHKISYNVHNLLHISQCVREYGNLSNFSAYKCENYLQDLKKMIGKPNQILQQLNKRIMERHLLNENKKNSSFYLPRNANNNNIPFPGLSFRHHGYKFNAFILKNNLKDGFCLIDTNISIFISEFGKINHEAVVLGYRFLDIKPFFEEPINSQDMLGIVSCRDLSDKLECFPISSIMYKYYRFQIDNNNILIPILHHI